MLLDRCLRTTSKFPGVVHTYWKSVREHKWRDSIGSDDEACTGLPMLLDSSVSPQSATHAWKSGWPLPRLGKINTLLSSILCTCCWMVPQVHLAQLTRRNKADLAQIWESQHLAVLSCLHLLFLFVALGLFMTWTGTLLSHVN
jgi:hypothetical protein